MGDPLPGRSASPGAELGPAFVVADRRGDEAPKSADDPGRERARADAALGRAREDLERLAERVSADAGAEQAEIFLAHADLAGDPELAGRIHAAIAAGASAERAVSEGFGAFRALLERSSSELLAARAADLDDVRDQVLDVLGDKEQASVPTERCVVVATELSPSQTARIPRHLLAGIACEQGSPTSHAAILARALRIPAVVGVAGLLAAVQSGRTVAVDGDAGLVHVDPEPATRAEIADRADARAHRAERLRRAAAQPCVTADGRRIEVAANVDGPDALEVALAHGAEGSGLVRTELLFLDAATPPSVDEQSAYYQRVLGAFPGQRVVFRTMDIGADKPLPFVDRGGEANPALGLRGVRLGLARPELLRDQMRALLRAGADTGPARGHLAIMFPLVSRVDELVRVRALLEEAAADEGVPVEDVEIGAMIEVPSAALAVRRLARHLHFVSLGTNDLLQYLFAVDRTNADVAGLPELFDPDVLRLLRDTVEGAHEAGAWVGVCGEAAADPLTAAALVGAGVDELSATPTAIPEVKDALRTASASELARAVAEAVTLPDHEQVRARIAAARGERA